MDNRNKPGTTGTLAGKRVVVTRAPEQASELIRALEALGAEVLLLPTVGFAPAEDPTELDAAFARLAEFDWILFTSQNAVRFFCIGWSESGRERSALGSVRGRVAAVGAATARLLKSEGMRVEYVAQTQTGESLAAELRDSFRGQQSSVAAQRSRGRSVAVSAARGRRQSARGHSVSDAAAGDARS